MTIPTFSTPDAPPRGFRSTKERLASLSADDRIIVDWALNLFYDEAHVSAPELRTPALAGPRSLAQHVAALANNDRTIVNWVLNNFYAQGRQKGPELKTGTGTPAGFRSIKSAISTLHADDRTIAEWILRTYQFRGRPIGPPRPGGPPQPPVPPFPGGGPPGGRPPPIPPGQGACCHPDGTCEITYAGDCSSPNLYQDQVSCDDAYCTDCTETGGSWCAPAITHDGACTPICCYPPFTETCGCCFIGYYITCCCYFVPGIGFVCNR